ncbi:RIP homotypic interaction motif-containing protein [Streptomyces lunaelactis]|uniref:RIP homotypic interaction motif-containing protein n=1 Tax=Streptomyces lunaelactis TaxID=1535768 RepID=UPI001584E97E|nr:RIP homotypic interaction motif-containing protein [Streptomyces lunaelactis]NUK05660.1 hypothetical protein [Streptomyces lunaelactis]NUK20078.1 hypothetical protein [Streptomyces lunaelactis]
MHNAYHALTRRLRSRLDDRDAHSALERFAEDPEHARQELASHLAASGACEDDAILDAARQLTTLAAAAPTGGVTVNAQHAQGVQTGNHNTQHNTFGPPPA